MARYIDADELLKNLPDDLPYKASVKRVLIQAPTADVVPKCEAEEYRKIAEHQQSVSMRRYFEIKRLKEELAKAKQEVAREIFEEIENFITNECLTAKDSRDIEGYVKSSVHYGIAELKKKYTGNKGECQND